MDPIDHYSSVKGHNGVFLAAPVNHWIRSKPSGGDLVASPTRTAVIEKDQISRGVDWEVWAKGIPAFRLFGRVLSMALEARACLQMSLVPIRRISALAELGQPWRR